MEYLHLLYAKNHGTLASVRSWRTVETLMQNWNNFKTTTAELGFYVNCAKQMFIIWGPRNP
eukprot:3455310-Amphidinium_carterae.1